MKLHVKRKSCENKPRKSFPRQDLFLKKCVSNEVAVIEDILLKNHLPGLHLQDGNLPTVKTLGVIWKESYDVFTFNVKAPPKKDFPDNRNTSYLIPCNFWHLFTTRSKILSKKTWAAGLQRTITPRPVCVMKRLDQRVRRFFKSSNTLSPASFDAGSIVDFLIFWRLQQCIRCRVIPGLCLRQAVMEQCSSSQGSSDPTTRAYGSCSCHSKNICHLEKVLKPYPSMGYFLDRIDEFLLWYVTRVVYSRHSWQIKLRRYRDIQIHINGDTFLVRWIQWTYQFADI